MLIMPGKSCWTQNMKSPCHLWACSGPKFCSWKELNMLNYP